MLRHQSSSNFQPRSCSMAVMLLCQDESPTTLRVALHCTLSSSVMSFLRCGSQTEALYSIMEWTKVKYACSRSSQGLRHRKPILELAIPVMLLMCGVMVRPRLTCLRRDPLESTSGCELFVLSWFSWSRIWMHWNAFCTWLPIVLSFSSPVAVPLDLRNNWLGDTVNNRLQTIVPGSGHSTAGRLRVTRTEEAQVRCPERCLIWLRCCPIESRPLLQTEYVLSGNWRSRCGCCFWYHSAAVYLSWGTVSNALTKARMATSSWVLLSQSIRKSCRVVSSCVS